LSTDIIVPCRNEAGEIGSLLRAISSHLKGNDKLIVVEGGSFDATFEIVSSFAAKNLNVIALKQDGKGKFDAVLTGIRNANQEYVMIWDADGTVSFEDNLKIYDFQQGNPFLITGDRLRGDREPKAMQFFNVLGNYFFAMIWGLLLKTKPLDPLCGSKKFPRNLLEFSPNWLVEKDPYGDFSILATAMYENLSIVTIPVDYSARRYGKTNIHRWSGGWLLLKLIIKIIRSRFRNEQ
jgi:glycosyltransferase involved in cell wall biosynthesis